MFIVKCVKFLSESLSLTFLQAWCVWSPAAQWWSSSCYCVHRQVWHLYLFLALSSAFLPDLIYQAQLECNKSTAQSGQWAIQSLIFPPHYLVYLSTFTPSPSEGRGTGEKASLAANIGLRVKGGRPVCVTFDPSAGPCGLAKLMRRDNVDLMVLCIDYPSLLCCLVGVLLPSLFSCCWIHEY